MNLIKMGEKNFDEFYLNRISQYVVKKNLFAAIVKFVSTSVSSMRWDKLYVLEKLFWIDNKFYINKKQPIDWLCDQETDFPGSSE